MWETPCLFRIAANISMLGMTTLESELRLAAALSASVSKDSLTIELADGRTITAPLAWYPRLQHGTPAERNNWRLIGNGEGIHWPDLDEDISVKNVLAGKRSGESPGSFQRWLASRSPKTLRAKAMR